MSDPKRDYRIVVDCPTCKRTIWANSHCDHGVVQLTSTDETPKEGKKGVVTITKGRKK